MADENDNKVKETRWIPIFRADDYGRKGKYSTEDLDNMIEDYGALHEEAPAILDHDDTGDAQGWTSQLRRVGKVLQAKFKDVTPELETKVKTKRRTRVSVEIYPKYSQTDRPYLKAVGFLGAMSPAVKGLSPVEFNANGQLYDCFQDDGEYYVSLSSEDMVAESTKGVKMSKDKQQFTDEQINQWKEDSAKLQEVEAEAAKLRSDLEGQKQKNDSLTGRMESLEKFAEAQRYAVHKQKVDQKIEGLKTDGKVTKAQEVALRPLLYSLSDETQVKFTDEEGKEQELGVLSLAFKALESGPQQVKLGRQVPQGQALDLSDDDAIVRKAEALAAEELKEDGGMFNSEFNNVMARKYAELKASN